MRKLLLAILFLPTLLYAELMDPVHWSLTTSPKGDSVSVCLKAAIDEGWHLYDLYLPEDGPIPTEISVDGIVPDKVSANKEPIVEYDENFEMDLSYFNDSVSFVFIVPLSSKPMVGSVRYMACSGIMCIPPTEYEFRIEAAEQTDREVTDKSLWWIFLMGMLAGLLAIFTPCVWPIIPMTVSFFIKKGEKNVVLNAVCYGLSIIVIYVGLGLLITLIFGASALNSLATNAVVNLLFFVLLLIFAFSFFGAFEITLPSSWSTALDGKASKATGFLSILLMAFTLVIVSFSCTGPIIGTLLVEVAGHSLLAPIIGMFGFALALALPFTIFALFPNWMKRLPRSGSWMDTFKITLAFLELALSLKFFSVADLAYGWHLLDREVFVSLWIVIFGLLGIYLLGGFRFRHEQPAEGIGVPRFLLAVASLAFSIYMLPGLWGAPLKAISAFAPPMYTQDWTIENGDGKNQTQPKISMDDLETAITRAAQHNKTVMLDFSGYGCVNCRKMEAAVLSDERVKRELERFEILTLMVDDKQSLPQTIEVEENGRMIKLRTIGDQWSYLQRSRYGANAQPYYVKLDSQGNQTGEAYSYNEDIDSFIEWLNKP